MEKSDKVHEKTLMEMTYAELCEVVSFFEDDRFARVIIPLLTSREDKHIRTLISGKTAEDCDKARGGIADITWLLSLHDGALSLAKQMEAEAAKI
jgi:hypothetical protein